MAGRMHPSPRFMIVERVIAADGFTKVSVGDLKIAFVVLDFAVKHRSRDIEDRQSQIVEDPPFRGNPSRAVIESTALPIRMIGHFQEGISQPPRIMSHGYGHRIQVWIVGDRLPAAGRPPAKTKQKA